MEKKLKVYVASPYTKGDVAINVKVNVAAGDRLYTLGYIPFIPLLTHFWNMLHPRPYEDWTDYDDQWIEVCDVLLRLPGDSKGADHEVDLTISLGIPVVYSEEELLTKYPPSQVLV